MIIRDRPGMIRLFFIFRESVLQRIFPQVLVVVGLSALVVWGHAAEPGLIPSVVGAPFALVGIALSVFLGFRNNACYDRWWEARKVWGHLIAICRDLSRQTLLLVPRGEEARAARTRLVHLTVVFAEELVRHLRGREVANRSAQAILANAEATAFAASANPPEYLLRRMGEILVDLRTAGTISDIEFSLLDRTVVEMNGAMTACERLRNTPVPFGYTLLLHRTAYLFCFMLPFGFADVLGFATPLAAGVVAYTFFGLDALSEELEEPFGTLPNDLPLQSMARTIEINLREALGETDLPEPIRPKDFILM